MKTGDTVVVKSVTLPSPYNDGILIKRAAKVVYVHPRNRFCVVEFTVGEKKMKFRESFFLNGGEIFVTQREIESQQRALARARNLRLAHEASEQKKQERRDYLKEYQRKRRERIKAQEKKEGKNEIQA